jgi:hypothetical protein
MGVSEGVQGEDCGRSADEDMFDVKSWRGLRRRETGREEGKRDTMLRELIIVTQVRRTFYSL